MEGKEYKEKLKNKMDIYIHEVYKVSRNFPKDELYGVVSQLRRSSLSIILNYIEGFARRKRKAQLNFLEISYGSFKESKYLIYFSYKEKYLNEVDYRNLLSKADEIGAMLWTELSRLDKSI